jgi:hypothetical protein
MSGADSRLSKTNPADPNDGGLTASARQSRKRPLTERDGVSLRAEVRDWDALDGDRAATWAASINRWREYIRDRRDVESVFENGDGKRVQGSKPHRFAPEYSEKQYAKLKDLERGLADEYGKRLHTAMLTFTASGDGIAPADHLDELDSSWSAVTRSLRRVLDGRRYERLAILEPHPGNGTNNGYLHIHMAVFVDGPVSASTFQPVLDAHVRNCDRADRDAHGVDDVQVRHTGGDRDRGDDESLDELAIYLAEYLGTYGDDDPLDAPEHVQAANALLWATEKRRWRPSNGAQQYMATEPRDSESEWDLVGIDRDGEVIDVDPEDGGVDRFTTSTDPPP